jgi:hypothetical protein
MTDNEDIDSISEDVPVLNAQIDRFHRLHSHV